ncbi:MAG: copper resistance protein CopC [Gemmatimonadota bacterium]|nr:copper resistance protein CopC [Gemmatimonadota bacterium]
MRTRWLAAVAMALTAIAMSFVPSSAPLVADTAPRAGEVPAALHLALDHSAPEADETVSSVDRVSLWFTQSPQIAGTSIRVVPEGGEPLDLGKAKMSAEDDKLIELAIPDGLVAGAYTIYWRAMAQDGHTVRGDFGFRVRAGR